jgi:hypothetical protein
MMVDPSHYSDSGVPLRRCLRTHDRIIIAHHLVLHGYGFWLRNDPRGSGSVEFHDQKFANLGPIHTGRKAVQPSRGELKKFWEQSRPRLDYPLVWFDEAKRQATAEAFAEVIRHERYTAWGCAVLANPIFDTSMSGLPILFLCAKWLCQLAPGRAGSVVP